MFFYISYHASHICPTFSIKCSNNMHCMDFSQDNFIPINFFSEPGVHRNSLYFLPAIPTCTRVSFQCERNILEVIKFLLINLSILVQVFVNDSAKTQPCFSCCYCFFPFFCCFLLLKLSLKCATSGTPYCLTGVLGLTS